MPVVTILDPRQCGKSTLAAMFAENNFNEYINSNLPALYKYMTSSDDPNITVSYSGSIDSFVLDGGVEFITDLAEVTLVCGLHKRSTYSEIAEVEFGIKLNSDSTLSVMELGVENHLSSKAYQADDLFQLVREGIDMVYYQNQDEIYHSTQPR